MNCPTVGTASEKQLPVLPILHQKFDEYLMQKFNHHHDGLDEYDAFS